MRRFSVLRGVLILTLTEVCAATSRMNLTIPDVIYGTLGEPVTLPATFSTDRRVMNIAWYKLDSRDPSSRTQIFSYYPPLQARESYGDYVGRTSLRDEASLRIARTRPEDEGRYILSVSVEGVGSSEGQIQLFLMVPPTLRVGPSDPYVTAWGKPAFLTCAVKGAKPNITSLHWEKNGVAVDTSGPHTKFVGGNLQRPSLHIRHVGRADSGVYACVAGHVVTIVRASLALNVYYPSSILSISDSVTATVSDHITLQCVADGNPPPNITWSRDGVWLPSNSRRLTKDAYTSTLQLRDVRVNDSGMYWCRTSNQVGRGDSRSLQVTVKESRLGIGISTLAVVVGATDSVLAIVVCVALSTYIVRRRRLQCGKKATPVYPKGKAARQEPSRVEGMVQTTQSLPYVTTPAKPPNGTTRNGSIDTIRRTLGQKERRYARALYSYRPREENELRLEADDVIEVLEGEDGGWCLGYLKGRIGLFPSNYVRFTFSPAALHIGTVRRTDDAGTSSLQPGCL